MGWCRKIAPTRHGATPAVVARGCGPDRGVRGPGPEVRAELGEKCRGRVAGSPAAGRKTWSWLGPTLVPSPSPLRASMSPSIRRSLSGGRWPTAGTHSLRALTAHAPTTPARPCPLRPRDQDAVIRTRLTRAAHEGGLVLVVGDSTAGKTRVCFEALRAELRMCAPRGPEHRGSLPSLRQVPGRGP